MHKLGTFVMAMGMGLAICGLTITTLEFLAGWHQYVVDRAYDTGRDTERVCRENTNLVLCKQHDQNTGHYIFSRKKDAPS